MDKELLKKYVAIKPVGFSGFIWFETEKVQVDFVHFTGVDGWGKNAALTNIKCKLESIQCFIHSDELQYSYD